VYEPNVMYGPNDCACVDLCYVLVLVELCYVLVPVQCLENSSIFNCHASVDVMYGPHACACVDPE
jgi:hypothetical protein